MLIDPAELVQYSKEPNVCPLPTTLQGLKSELFYLPRRSEPETHRCLGCKRDILDSKWTRHIGAVPGSSCYDFHVIQPLAKLNAKNLQPTPKKVIIDGVQMDSLFNSLGPKGIPDKMPEQSAFQQQLPLFLNNPETGSNDDLLGTRQRSTVDPFLSEAPVPDFSFPESIPASLHEPMLDSLLLEPPIPPPPSYLREIPEVPLEQLPNGTWIRRFPGASATYGRSRPRHVIRRCHQDTADVPVDTMPHWPFASECEWEVAVTLSKFNAPEGLINELLKTKYVRVPGRLSYSV